MKPEHFDILGVPTFTFIAALALYALQHQGQVPNWALVVLVLIGISGLLIDGTIVYQYFIRKKK